MADLSIKFRVADLPRLPGGITVRAFRVRNDLNGVLKKNEGIIHLREGMNLSEAAEKIGAKKNKLGSMGISQDGILWRKLIKHLKKQDVEERGNWRDSDKLRHFPEIRYARMIVGRIGNEDEVFGEFKIWDIVQRETMEEVDKARIVAAYLKKADLKLEDAAGTFSAYLKLLKTPDVQSQAIFTFEAARIMDPITPHLQWDFIWDTCDELYKARAFREIGISDEQPSDRTSNGPRFVIGDGAWQSSKVDIFLNTALKRFGRDEFEIVVKYLTSKGPGSFQLGTPSSLVPGGFDKPRTN